MHPARAFSKAGPQARHAIFARLFSTAPQEGILFAEHLQFGEPSQQQPARLAVVLHGLLGAGKNLRSYTVECFRQAAAASGTSWHALLVDLRNHGKSAAKPGFSGPHTLASAAADVIRTVAAGGHGRIDALIGHSLGGKVCLEVSQQLMQSQTGPMPPPRQVWALDTRPGRVAGGAGGLTDDVEKVLDTVQGIPLPVPSREWLYDYLHQRGMSKGLQMWMGSNLVPRPGSKALEWSFKIAGAREMYESYLQADYTPLLRCPPAGSLLHVVRAARSDRWDAAAEAELDAVVGARGGDCGETAVHEVADAGHWLHVDNPKGLAAVMLPHLM